jgi:hypothetical protein
MQTESENRAVLHGGQGSGSPGRRQEHPAECACWRSDGHYVERGKGKHMEALTLGQLAEMSRGLAEE